MIWRTFLALAVAIFFSACESPYKKSDEAEKQPLRHQAKDTSFLAFTGRLRIAVANRDMPMLTSMMTNDFGFRWDTVPPGETPFGYWDQNNLWGELSSILKEQFGPKGQYMVAPAQAVDDPEYKGYRAGLRLVTGSWKFAYFVSGDGAE